MNTSLECILDWLQFTIHSLNHEDVILQVLEHELADYIELPKGRFGYKSQYLNGNIGVLYDGSENMGVHVYMTGKGCRQYEAEGDLLELIQRVSFYDGNCTRIDLAVDDRTGEIIKFNRMIESVNKGHVVSKWKTSTEIIKRDIAGGTLMGQTLALGSRSSKIYLRIYDKALEQEAPGPWYRMELEIKDDRAEVLQNILLFDNDIGKLISGILNQYIRFVVPSEDKNKSRWPTAKWWLDLVRDMDRLKLTQKPRDKSIEEVRAWVDKQIGPTLAMLMIHDEGDLSEMFRIINSGRERMKDKHFRMLKKAGQGRESFKKP